VRYHNSPHPFLPLILTIPLELFDFQAKLTSEKVVLDIGSVRMVRLGKASSRSSTQFSSARLQMWHEVLDGRSRNPTSTDVASFVTAGTALSGPLRDRLVASSSRLMLYLGRSGGFVSVFSRFLFFVAFFCLRYEAAGC
jgi:hypothetical protein